MLNTFHGGIKFCLESIHKDMLFKLVISKKKSAKSIEFIPNFCLTITRSITKLKLYKSPFYSACN